MGEMLKSQQPDKQHTKAKGHQWVFNEMRNYSTRRRASAGVYMTNLVKVISNVWERNS